MFAAGHGVLRSRLGDGPDQEHQGQLSERGVDRLHLPRDSQGEWKKKNVNGEEVERSLMMFSFWMNEEK